MSFTEVCIYQVKPDKVEEFESIMNEAKPFLEERAGLLQLRLMKRGYKNRHGTDQRRFASS